MWSDQSFPAAIANSGERRITPEQVRYVTLDMATLRSQLAQAATGTVLDRRSATTTISLPTPTGGAADFRVLEVSIMHPDLQAQFPNIRTYSGVGVDDVGTTVKLDITEHGFHAMVMPPTREAWFIDPLFVGNTTNYQVYAKKNFVKTHTTEFLGCGYDQVNDLDAAALQTRQWIEQMGVDRVGDCQLRTYRLALACTGEYAAFHGGTTGGVMSAMTTTMNRVNDMFERDATLTMVLVANNSSLIFLDAGTDPFSNGDGSAMLGENQTTCTNVIGGANYDIGHVFSTGGGGIASLNSPCSSSRKAQGVTGQSNPVGDPFDIDYVAHEMGHQYGGNHTQNNSCNRASTAAVEVGSGVTIMGYAGICAPNPLNNSIAMFGGYSMQEIAANVTSGTSSTCPATTTIIGETAPTVSAGVDRTIPRSTPFVLTAIGSDAQTSQTLTYSWEQMDNAVATMPPVATNTGGPAWVPKLPTTSPVRWMPNLDDVIANNSPTWEVLSSVGRTYNFRVTVRDNLDNGACNDQDNMVVTVASNSGPFLVTQPNTAVSWPALSSQTITWDVANTTASPVSCANVNILLSTDGGQTFPTTLLANTPNDGTQTVTLSNSPSTTARIKIEGANNIFYDMSNTNFTISASSPDYSLNVTDATASACQPSNATYAVQIGSLLGYTNPVTLSTSALPTGANATFSTNPVTPGGSTTLTISNTAAVTPGTYAITLNATSASGPRSLPLTLSVLGSPGQVTLLAPANGEPAATGPLTWNADPNAETYTVTLGSNAAMTTVLETGSGVVGTSYQPTTANAPNTTYYWNVRAVNTCATATPSATWSYTTSDCQPVTVQITLDRYGAETTWTIKDASQNTVASGGPYTTVGTNGEYPQPDIQLCLPAGCYDLTVNDSANDGLCCAYGNGYIAVLDGVAPLAYAGSFANTVTVNFCVGGGCVTTFPYAEDFESGLGEWLQNFGDDMDWTRLSGSTASSNTGPSGDHTTGSGFYLYTEASNSGNPSKVAELIGPCIDLSGLTTANMTFWYNMLGANMGTLNVDVWNGSSWTNGVFSISGAQGSNWIQGTVDLDPFVGSTIRVRFRGVTGNGFASDMAIDDIQFDGSATQQVLISAKAFLQGPYVEGTGLMNDDLRAASLVPLNEPYTLPDFLQVLGGGETTTSGVLGVTGNDAIVDWVLLELRSGSNSAQVIATRSALIQRDGDIVDVDGVSPVSFPVATANYYVAVRHRNHLACMAAAPVSLSATTTSLDFSTVTTFGTEAQLVVGGKNVLWAGNVVVDDEVLYTGQGNDRDPILTLIGGVVPTNTAAGYHLEDVNMDGVARYTGTNNDRDIILENIGGTVPTNSRAEQLP
ncbi:MAG: reprolysin-like metallopeptidase [Flavobacteriales bacterium]